MEKLYRKGAHSIYSIYLHTYFVTRYRRKVLTHCMIDRAQEVAGRVTVAKNCILLECDGEADHIHLLIDMHPDVAPSRLLGSIKSAVSRILRSEFEPELRKHFWDWDKGLWGDQLYMASVGGAPLESLKQYIQAHSRG